MRIGLNLLYALPEVGGSWTYVANLIEALAEYDNSNTYIAFVTRFSQCLVPAKSNFSSVVVDINASSRFQRVLYENTVLPWLARHYEIDCMHWFANTQALTNSVPGVVTVYDLMVFENPSVYPLIKRIYLQSMMFMTSKKSSILLPMSQATRRELLRVLKIDAVRMVVIPAVLSSQFRRVGPEDIIGFRNKYGLPSAFWLYVAHFYPHKNHARLLRAYYEIRLSHATHWPLVFRGDPKGAEAEVKETIAKLGLADNVIFLPQLSQTELPMLYSTATALVFPSLYEGGGIPIVEAMACGCPVVASNIPSVREFAGNAASYFEPLDPVSIAGAMSDLQRDDAALEARRRAGLTRAEEFRGQQIVSKVLQAYRAAARR